MCAPALGGSSRHLPFQPVAQHTVRHCHGLLVFLSIPTVSIGQVSQVCRPNPVGSTRHLAIRFEKRR